MFDRDAINIIITTRLLKDYFNAIQEAMGMLMVNDITIDELEDILEDLDVQYAKLILRETNKRSLVK